MPRKGTRRPESSRERPRPNRSKLDARLEFLLALPAPRRAALMQEEARQLREIATEIRAARAALDAEATDSGKARARERLRAAEGQVFAPLSMGFHGPEGRRGAAPPPAKLKEPFISAFILSDASAADLGDLGAQVRSRAGDVFTAYVPLSAISRLEASAAVRYIELARPVFPALDVAIQTAQIDTLHNATPGITGAGVVVGIVDLGVLDIYHPGFRTATGATRVLYLWDQTLPAGSGPAPAVVGLAAPIGVEYDQATIDAELNHPAGTPAYQTVQHGGDVLSHGTFVAGIAAGNGLGEGGSAFVGAAPEADIIYVRLKEPAFAEIFADSTQIADAFRYIFARAGAKPCVVNMSASDDLGPHDGTAAGEQFLDTLLNTPGRAITLAAGNANNQQSHASGTVAPGGVTNLVLRYSAGATKNDAAEIWYDGHDRLTVTLTAPTNPATVVGPVAHGFADSQPLPGGGSVSVTSDVDPRNGDNFIKIIIALDPGQAVPTGNWTIALNGTTVINGAFHAWVDRNNRAQSAWQAPHRQENLYTLSTPATARRAIAVGNHNAAAAPLLESSSSRGPSRDGRIEPEITAVGVAVTATRSRDMNAQSPGALYQEHPNPGTSWSAPLVAGACALLFECRGATATWANLKQILEDNAFTTGLSVPSPGFGFGSLRMANACAGSLPATDAWLRDDVTDTGLEPFTGPVAWMSPDIEVLDTNGNLVANPTFHPTNRFNNIVRVTVRNRGSQPARNTEVFLYWADPATNIPYPSAWRTEKIFTGSPNFVTQGNTAVIPLLQPGASTQVQFAWAPPAPGSSLSQDNHFCLLVRVENEGDPSQAGVGGWSVITARNNIALRNVLVQPAPSTMGFWVVGSADQDSLIIRPQDAEIELLIPIAALPWRDRRFIERHGARTPYGRRGADDPLRTVKTALKGDDIGERTDVFGATTLELYDGVARIRASAERGLVLKSLRLLDGARMPVRLNVKARTEAGPRFVHAAQYSGGQLIGGVSLQFGRTKYGTGQSA
ncbi:MAG TPA: S8 family serine peptidase [Methylomirabilota bacterium]|nr:S8 family serine peptidase [Methylomirabilota bacterium]